MKNSTNMLLGIGVFATAAYLTWVHTPLGKNILSKWLLNKWEQSAQGKKKTLDQSYLKKELHKLNYRDHELLARYTLLDPMGKAKKLEGKAKKQFEKLHDKMMQTKLFERADLSPLENIVLPG